MDPNIFKTNMDENDSDSDEKPQRRKVNPQELLDKIDFDNIPSDVPFNFMPMGMQQFQVNPDDDSGSENDDTSASDQNVFKMPSYNDIYQHIENDLKKTIKMNGFETGQDVKHSNSEKISFPLAPGQNVASLEELKVDLEKARKASNHKMIVSLCSSCARKATSDDEKIKYLSEKFKSLQKLKMHKLCEEVAQEILIIDPQNAEYKFYQTKLFVQNSANIWISQREYLRSRSLIERKLSDYKEDYDLNKYLGELEQIYYSIKIKVDSQKTDQMNYMQIGGSNTNGTCGIGNDESTKDSYKALNEFYNCKISSVATGDFHTLVICEVMTTKDSKEIDTNAGNTDILSFGLNQYGQVDGIPSFESILYPKVISFFIGKRPRLVSACRSRSVALTEDGKVYEWGFLGSDKKQFHLLHDFSQDTETDADGNETPWDIIDIKCGPEYTMFLNKNGKAWIIGTISQIGEYVFESEELVSLNEMILKSSVLEYTPDFAKDFMETRLKEKGEIEEQKDVFITKLDAGYSHAIILDSNGLVYVFGAGHYGQLGLGFDIIKAKKPILVDELNDGFDKIISVAWGVNSCLAYSELGLLYAWGMLNDTDPDTITYFPTPIGTPDNIMLAHINAQSREIIAWDVFGDLYHCDLEFRRRLEYTEKSRYLDKNIKDFFIRKVYWGRSMRILLDSVLSPEKCVVDQKVDRMETLMENEITLELYDILNEAYSLKNDESVKKEIFDKIKIIFLTSKDPNLSYFKIADYKPTDEEEQKIETKTVGKFKIKHKAKIEEDSEEEDIITTKSEVTKTNFHKPKPKINVKSSKKPKVISKNTIKKSTKTKRSQAESKPVKLEIVDPNTENFEEDKSELEESHPNELNFSRGDYNQVGFKVYYEIDEEFPSKLLCKISPQNGDEFEKVYWRVFIGNTELKLSNFEVQIVKSQVHLDLEAENQRKKEQDHILREQRRLAKLKAQQEKERKRKEREEERLRQQKMKEEVNYELLYNYEFRLTENVKKRLWNEPRKQSERLKKCVRTNLD